jgi:hypothetical protein
MKTLKDLIKDVYVDDFGTDEQYAFEKDIRQAAIEWVNHIEEEVENHRKLTHGFEGITQWDYAQVEWIINFFNLTEEDLK